MPTDSAEDLAAAWLQALREAYAEEQAQAKEPIAVHSGKQPK